MDRRATLYIVDDVRHIDSEPTPSVFSCEATERKSTFQLDGRAAAFGYKKVVSKEEAALNRRDAVTQYISRLESDSEQKWKEIMVLKRRIQDNKRRAILAQKLIEGGDNG